MLDRPSKRDVFFLAARLGCGFAKISFCLICPCLRGFEGLLSARKDEPQRDKVNLLQ